MKTSVQSLAQVLATAIWADGMYDEAEKVTITQIADAFETPELEAEVAKNVADLEGKDADAVNDLLDKAAQAVDEEEMLEVYEAVLEIVLSDGVLTPDETQNVLAIAEAMGLDNTFAVMLLCDKVQQEDDIEVQLYPEEE